MRTYRQLTEIDFTRALPFGLLAAVYVLTRLPFIDYGHGTDPDAWRVAMTAHHLVDTGDYFPSRLPGNPLHELVTTIFIPGGWIATNLSTMAVSLAGVYLFALIVRLHAVPNAGVLVVGFAFAPLLFINSIATMDYMWALTAILGAYYCQATGRPLWAGVLLGLAMGFRLQSFVAWAPLAYLAWRQGRIRDLAPLTLAMGGVALLCFAPVLVVYGTDFFNYYDAEVNASEVVRLVGKEALGIIGALGVLLAVLISLLRFRTLPGDLVREPQVGVWVGFIIIYTLAFARLPHEIAYLIPVFPFGLLLLGRYLTRIAITGAVAAILLAGVVDVTTPDEGFDSEAFRSATLGKGLVLSNAETMDLQRKFVSEVIEADVPDHAVVMTGFIFPQLAVRERDRLDARILRRDYEGISMLSDRGEAVDEARDLRYVWLVDYNTFMALRAQGYAIFQVPDAATSTAALYDYRPGILGATFLRLDQEAPAGEGAGSTDR
ncbi:MAG TPA: hypothetical protein VG845_07530 [Dehalococcoidia bacterium]|nr:hypothetical protein [Dehalococcoidia bacterium]